MARRRNPHNPPSTGTPGEHRHTDDNAVSLAPLDWSIALSGVAQVKPPPTEKGKPKPRTGRRKGKSDNHEGDEKA
jgi:hypothetical protein